MPQVPLTSSRASSAAIRRCPACGQRIGKAPPPRCPLCDYRFDDEKVTGLDVTPFAKAYSRDQKGWWEMAKWVWSAEWVRLTHLALMRGSVASAFFSRLGLVLLAGAFAIFDATRKGWRFVTDSPAIELGSLLPVGEGWLHVASAPRPLPLGHPPDLQVDLWWNMAQTFVAAAIVMTVGWFALWLLMQLIRAGANRAHKPAYRGEKRMSAAIQYSTAWAVPIILGASITLLRPISYMGKIAAWPWYPPRQVFELAAAVVVGFGVVMWWFWLVRLGFTAPRRTRGRVVAFFALGVPVLVAGAGVGWWFGVEPHYAVLFELLGVNF